MLSYQTCWTLVSVLNSASRIILLWLRLRLTRDAEIVERVRLWICLHLVFTYSRRCLRLRQLITIWQYLPVAPKSEEEAFEAADQGILHKRPQRIGACERRPSALWMQGAAGPVSVSMVVSRSTCKECGGASICEHGRVRAMLARVRRGQYLWTHGRVRYTCRSAAGPVSVAWPSALSNTKRSAKKRPVSVSMAVSALDGSAAGPLRNSSDIWEQGSLVQYKGGFLLGICIFLYVRYTNDILKWKSPFFYLLPFYMYLLLHYRMLF